MKSENKFNRSEADDGDEDENSWQNSYSDLMTDLLAIFVILFSFAMMSQASVAFKQKRAEASIKEQILPYQEAHNSIFESIEAYINEEGLSEQLSVTDQGNNIILLRAKSSVFFDSGQAGIKPNAEPILDNISQIIKKYSDSIKMVRIEGHTDNRPMHNNQFDSNWELSTTRAVNVLRRLLEISKLKSEKLSAVGYGEFHPIADNATEDGKAINRRVDFIIETVDD